MENSHNINDHDMLVLEEESTDESVFEDVTVNPIWTEQLPDLRP